MKISYNWLKDYITPLPEPKSVAALLTGCGLEVETTEPTESNDDFIFEIGLTPNHADAASHYGVARDLYAVIHHLAESKIYNLKSKISLPPIVDFKIDNKDLQITVEVTDAAACPRYSGITISNIKVVESPAWIKNKLKTIGISPINNIVDVTNYVLHECGQPLHAFDADEIKGKKIIVRHAHEGEKFISLDEKERTLSPTDLMICNVEEAMGIAGVFGGMKSGIKTRTKNIFIESAYFDPRTIRKTAKYHCLKTDASFRYERGTDPEITIYALKRAALLIKEMSGGKISSDVVDIYPKVIEPFHITVNYERMDKLAGIAIDRGIIKNILTSLNIKIEKEAADGLHLIVPSYKNDVTSEAAIVEEVLRIYGYNNIPMPAGIKLSVPKKEKIDVEKIQNDVSDYLSSQGFLEVINNSLTKSKWADDDAVKILNPLSSDLDVMRETLIYGCVQNIEYNRNRKQSNLKLYEFGKTYNKFNGSYNEENHLVLFLTGRRTKEQWNADKSNVSFFTIKSFVHNILSKCGVIANSQERKLTSFFFSGAMEIVADNTRLAQYGSLKKSVLKQFDITAEVFYADINWDALVQRASQHQTIFSELPKFPEVKRDLSMVLDRKVGFSDIEKIAFATEQKLLKEVNLFDVYEGDKIEQGKKSYAISFIIQDNAHTLTDAQIDKIMNSIMENLERQAGAVIRR